MPKLHSQKTIPDDRRSADVLCGRYAEFEWARFLRQRSLKEGISEESGHGVRPTYEQKSLEFQADQPTTRWQEPQQLEEQSSGYSVRSRKDFPESCGSSHATRACPSDRNSYSSWRSRRALGWLSARRPCRPLSGSEMTLPSGAVRRICGNTSLSARIPQGCFSLPALNQLSGDNGHSRRKHLRIFCCFDAQRPAKDTGIAQIPAPSGLKGTHSDRTIVLSDVQVRRGLPRFR